MGRDVVFIVLDTCRRDRLSPYNESIEFTENIQRFSKDAEVFQQAVSQAPWTLPSHASMFTGEYPWAHEATQKNLFLDSDDDTLAEKFKDSGYRTASISYNAYLSSDFGLVEGFEQVENFSSRIEELIPDKLFRKWNEIVLSDRFDSIKRKMMKIGFKLFHSQFLNVSDSDKVLERSKDLIKDFQRTEDDYFLFVNFMETHEPYYPSGEYKERHAPDVDPTKQCQDSSSYLSGEEDADFDAISKLYDATVDKVDDAVGELLDFLDDDTVVVICSDHGQMLGEDGMYGHQFSVAEELVHVPLMIRSPRTTDLDLSSQLELRELYNLVPQLAGIEEGSAESTEIALGGYEFPELAKMTLSDEAREKYYKQLRFARKRDRKAIQETDRNGDTGLSTVILPDQEETEIYGELEDKLDEIGSSDSGRSLEEQDEEVKNRLEKLGYLDR